MMDCASSDCTRQPVSRGYCRRCYQQHRALEGGFPTFKVEPFLAPIRARAAAAGSLSALAAELSARFGTNQQSEWRLLSRITRGEVTRLYDKTADRLATFFNIPSDQLERVA